MSLEFTQFARIHVKRLLGRLFEMLRLEQASIVKKSLLAISMMVAIAKIIGGLLPAFKFKR